MNVRTALFLAFRSYRPGDHKKKSSRPLMGAILGIALSLIPLIVVIHISDGMIEGITGRYLETFSYHLQLFSYNSMEEEDYQDLAEGVRALDGVTGTYVERRGFGLAYSEAGRTGITLRAIEESLYLEDEGFRQYMELREGAWDLQSERAILLGEEVARKLEVHPGDEIKILTGKIFPNGRYVPRVTPFVVKGIVSSGYQELDRMWVFIPLEQGMRMLSDDSSETMVGVKTDHPYEDLNPLISRIGAVARDNNENHRWRSYTWMSLSRSQQKSYQTTKMLLQIIMGLLVIVAVMNVSSSLIMLVMENSFEIGILKCIGGSPAGISRIYRYIGLSAGVLGTLLGLFLGVVISSVVNEIIDGAQAVINAFIRLFAWFSGLFHGGVSSDFELMNSAYYLQDIPINIEWGSLALIGIVTILLAWAASAFPAKKAGRIRPLEIIRKH